MWVSSTIICIRLRRSCQERQKSDLVSVKILNAHVFITCSSKGNVYTKSRLVKLKNRIAGNDYSVERPAIVAPN